MGFNLDKLGGYATDKDRELNGVKVWASDSVWFLIRRSGGANRDYDREIRRLSKPLRQQLQRGTLDNDEAEKRIVRPAFIRTVMMDWGGIEDDQGNAIAFSEAACGELFDAAPDIFELLRDKAGDLETFQREAAEDAADVLGKP